MADFASHLFSNFPESASFLTEFHCKFPLPQKAFWIEYHFPKKIIGCILLTLSTEIPALGLWRQLRRYSNITGGTGLTSFPAILIHTFKMWMQNNNLWSYKFLLNRQGRVHSVEESKFKLEASRQPLGPSPTLSNWLAGPTSCINQEQQTPHGTCHANRRLQMRRPFNSQTNGSACEGPKFCVPEHEGSQGPAT